MTKIEWTQSDDGTPGKTWNPTTGCDRVSPGCDNCYALAMARRLKGMGHAKYQTDGRPETSGPGFGVQTHPDTLDEPLRWRKPRRVFVNSMSDLFHPEIPDDFIAACWAVMWLAHRHTFQVLTKRPRRARALLSSDDWWCLVRDAADARYMGAVKTMGIGLDAAGPHLPLVNVWLGVSVEDQRRADERISVLMRAPAGVRFLSCEPLLGPIDLWRWEDIPPDWCIIGGESGPGARPMDLAWARSIIRQCRSAGIAPFVKQLGSRPTDGGVPRPTRGKGADPGEWPDDLRVRVFPEVVA